MKYLNIKTIGISGLLILLSLVFISKTVYTYNLTVVTGVSPEKGRLSKTETATGLADWANTEEIYAETAGKVEGITVKEGETVTKGQTIMTIRYDRDDIEQKLKENTISQNQKRLEIEKANSLTAKLNEDIQDLKAETYEAKVISGYELAQVRKEIEKAKEELERAQTLYQAGGASQKEVDDAAYSLESLSLKKENLEKLLRDSETDETDTLEEKEKDRTKQLRDYSYQLITQEQSLKSLAYDLEELELQWSAYRKSLEDFESFAAYTAPEDGIITSIPVKKGQTINESQLLASLGIGEEFEVTCQVSLDNNFIIMGDSCKLSNADHSLDGLVNKVTPTDNAKEITVTIRSEEVTSGETFDIRFVKESADTYNLVPNGAVNQDSEGYFLYQIKRRKGILGNEFYTEKLRVWIGDSDSSNTAITKGITFFEPIVLLSDKSFDVNQTVKLKNEGDFFNE